MQGYTGLTGAIADAYAEAGHSFYYLSFDHDNVTLAWDSETGLWHERGTWISESNQYVSWRPRFYAYAFGEQRVLDRSGGQLYRIGTDLTTDVDARAIRRLRRAPAIMRENKRIFYSGFELDLEPGIGTVSVADPQVMLRVSNDGGRTWITEQWRSAGKTGEFHRRVRWNRMGSARRRVFEVSVTDAVPWKITGAYLQTQPEVGAE